MATARSRADASEHAPSGGAFRALRHRDYRLLWIGQLLNGASQWMEQVIRPILVLELTGSATAVGALVLVRMLPVLLFGVLAGAVADRYNKKRILFVTQTTTMAMHFVLAALILGGQAQLWHIYATGLIAGAALAFNNPTRQSIVPRIVPPEDLVNAVALNSTAMNVMRVGGGALAGLLLIPFDIGDVYLLNGLIFIAVIVMTQLIRVPHEAPRAGQGSLLSDLGEGFAYVGRHRTVRSLVLLALILFVFGMPYQQVFIPLIAYRIFDLERSWVGWMLSCTGIGAITGSLILASRTEYRRPGMALLVSLVLFGGTLVGMGLSHWLPGTLLLLVLSGVMTTSFNALTNTLMLSASPPEMHGRMMSLLSLDRGIIPLGAMLAGFLADHLSTEVGLVVMGSGILLCSVFAFFLWVPSINTITVRTGVRRVRHA